MMVFDELVKSALQNPARLHAAFLDRVTSSGVLRDADNDQEGAGAF